ncbi:hypothetical protein TW95_gp0119 [Pandoravirus inopinatum]|uniref:Uncharacterized protein n=1 Tax=Pandoravirus inopinatum TaxID=1605721 RepID=A0A0B5IW09_9VIRU|nr:hypothetical protein TW95_gp0119 [Pandoravirus inopinatum]AJF96853.1 hypothetical protein [Pandoravirus inopinatum]
MRITGFISVFSWINRGSLRHFGGGRVVVGARARAASALSRCDSGGSSPNFCRSLSRCTQVARLLFFFERLAQTRRHWAATIFVVAFSFFLKNVPGKKGWTSLV